MTKYFISVIKIKCFRGFGNNCVNLQTETIRTGARAQQNLQNGMSFCEVSENCDHPDAYRLVWRKYHVVGFEVIRPTFYLTKRISWYMCMLHRPNILSCKPNVMQTLLIL